MKLTHLMAATTLAATLTLPLAAQDVKTDYDHKADFHAYHTFSFHKVQASDPFFESRIHDEVARELTARGLQMVPSGGDLNIAAIGGMSTQQEYNTFYDGLGGFGFGWRGWRGWGGGWAGPEDVTTTVTRIPVGTLVVDLYDHNTHQLVWRGTASDQLTKNSEKNTRKLDKAIDKMFDKYPPKTAM